jgi:hypothetical protein
MTSKVDGIHLDPESHMILGKEMAKYILNNIFKA